MVNKRPWHMDLAALSAFMAERGVVLHDKLKLNFNTQFGMHVTAVEGPEGAGAAIESGVPVLHVPLGEAGPLHSSGLTAMEGFSAPRTPRAGKGAWITAIPAV